MPRVSKGFAWFALLYGAYSVGAAALGATMAVPPLPRPPVAVWVLSGIAALAGGYFGLRRRRWAYWLLFVLFLAQSVQYQSAVFSFSLAGPLWLNVGWGWHTPPRHFNLNLLAAVPAVFALRLGRVTAREAPAALPAADEHPEWVRPAWLTVVLILAAVSSFSCIGLLFLSRPR